MQALLAALGRPQEGLPPVVHIAGTNGKGSVIAILRAILEAAGWRVHAYTSPHLVRFNERILLAGRQIDDGALADLLDEVEAVNAGAPITFFEITTAAAFLAFSRRPADVLLLETGLGGRFDATNVLDRPRLTVITPISLDHQHFLGAGIAAIAGEKAGIIKPGVPIVVASQPPEAHAVLQARAAELGAPLLARGAAWTVVPKADGFLYRGSAGPRDLPAPALPGRHQMDNAGLALACLDELAELPAPLEAVARGLGDVRWPGRLQRLDPAAHGLALPAGAELWLDGAHNPGGACALARWLDDMRARDGIDGGGARPVHLIVALQGHRDPQSYLRPLAGRVAMLHAAAIPGQTDSLPPAAIAAAARALGIKAEASAGVAAALAGIEAPARVVICGSLYLAGAVLARSAQTQ